MKRLTPIKAIRAKCLDCMCGQSQEVRLCTLEECSLFPYRLGHNPYIKRKYTEEQREVMRDRFKHQVLALTPDSLKGENDLDEQGVYKGTAENYARKNPTEDSGITVQK